MSKHTPGPWLIAGENKTFVYALGPMDTNVFWCDVQAAGKERAEKPELEANARLIAQAPRLLEALEDMVKVFEPLSGDCQDKLQAAVEEDAVRSAIAAIEATKGNDNG